MNFKKNLVPMALATLLFAACSKDPVESSNDNTVSTTPATNKCDYSPYSTGSTFTSELATKSFGDGKWSYVEVKGSITGLQTINNVKWSVGKGFFPADTSKNAQTNEGFIRCDDKGAYVLLKKVYGGQDMEVPYISYPATNGKTWKSPEISQSQQGVTTKFYYEYKIVNTGLTKTIKKNTYKDVIEIEESLVNIITFDGDTETIKTTYQRFFDKSVGHLQTIFFFDDPFTGNRDTALVQSLVSYSIK